MRRTDTNEFGEVEYDLDYSPPTSRRDSLKCEYVLPEPKSKIVLKIAPEEIPQPVRTKKGVQDIYDEDHYTIARPNSHSSFDPIKIPKTEDYNANSANSSKRREGICSIFKKKKTITAISIFFVLCIGGVVVAYLTLGKKQHTMETTNVEKGKIF